MNERVRKIFRFRLRFGNAPLRQLQAFLVAALCAPASANACSVAHVDGGGELVAGADAIYVATAMGYDVEPVPTRHHGRVELMNGSVRFAVIKVLKGATTEKLVAAGSLVSVDDFSDRPIPYDFVRPAGRHGDCVATAYKSGATYLLFLHGGTPNWSPLAPTNEQVRGIHDPWIKWVTEELARNDSSNR